MADHSTPLPGTAAQAGILTYLHKKSAPLGVPLSGTFELTGRCNFRCRMCYVHGAENGTEAAEELSAAKWLSIGEQAAGAGMLFLLITGGEPLLRADFAEIYTGLGKLGLCLSVNTNGSLLRGETAELFLRQPPNRLNISLYGASDETYRALCGVSAYNTVVNNILALQKRGIQIQLNVSMTPLNAADAGKIAAFAEEHGLHMKATAYLYPPVRLGAAAGENRARFSAAEAGRMRAAADRLTLPPELFLRRAKAIADGTAPPLNPCIDELQGTGSLCRAGRTAFWVDWRGRMSMCGMIGARADLKKRTFADCWNEIRAGTASIRLPAECGGCRYRAVCPVCAASCLAETGAFSRKPEYLCEMSRAYVEQTARLARESAPAE